MNSIDVYWLARSQDIRIKHYNFSDIDGICTRRWEKTYVGIRKGMSEIKTRETIAHEMGHLIDGTENVVHIRYAEWNAEKIGREILIPYDGLVRAIEDDEWICDTQNLARLFGVSPEMMTARVNELFNH